MLIKTAKKGDYSNIFTHITEQHIKADKITNILNDKNEI